MATGKKKRLGIQSLILNASEQQMSMYIQPTNHFLKINILGDEILDAECLASLGIDEVSET